MLPPFGVSAVGEESVETLVEGEEAVAFAPVADGPDTRSCWVGILATPGAAVNVTDAVPVNAFAQEALSGTAESGDATGVGSSHVLQLVISLASGCT
jgi:hypothetical protein